MKPAKPTTEQEQRKLERLFFDRPPYDWTPTVGESVLVHVGSVNDSPVIYEANVKARWKVPHSSGQAIQSFDVEFSDGSVSRFSKNSLRPKK